MQLFSAQATIFKNVLINCPRKYLAYFSISPKFSVQSTGPKLAQISYHVAKKWFTMGLIYKDFEGISQGFLCVSASILSLFSLDLWPHERKRILPEFPRLNLVWLEKI
jgi:hypothetical protein